VAEDFDLEELQELPLPRATPGDVPFPPDVASRYLPPRMDRAESHIECVGCGSHLNGLFSGTFRWGLAWGSGFCSRCRYPVRMYHEVDVDGKKEVLTFPLQPHPEDLRRRG
jgi:hypothetical protein